MDLPSFRALVERLAKDIPREFHDGVVAVDVRPATVPHPVHAGVYTLGECVPLEWSGNGADLHCRFLLYYGSFRVLARGDAARGRALRSGVLPVGRAGGRGRVEGG